MGVITGSVLGVIGKQVDCPESTVDLLTVSVWFLVSEKTLCVLPLIPIYLHLFQNQIEQE